jgi:uncharacterized protein (TIGR02001 family)
MQLAGLAMPAAPSAGLRDVNTPADVQTSVSSTPHAWRTTMHRCTRRTLALVLALPAAGASAGTLTGNVALTSDYLFRGISQTNHRPAVQAGVEYDGAGGGYFGGWGSNVSWLADSSTPSQPVSSSVELDACAGWRGDLGRGWRYDAGLYGYAYPGSYPAGSTRPHTLEGYAALGWKTLSLKYSWSFTNLFGVSGSRHSGYLDLGWSQPLAPGWQFDLHVGRQRVVRHGDASYSDWKLGVSRAFGHDWTATLGWYDSDARRDAYTNAEGRYLGRATLVLALARTF